MKYARIHTTEYYFNQREKSVLLETIFGNVYAPKSQVIVEHIDSDIDTGIGIDKTHRMTILVPCWTFWKAHANPCQLTTAKFIEYVNKEDK